MRRATGYEDRGKNPNRPSRKPLTLKQDSATALIGALGKYYEVCECSETPEDHIIPRRSLTVQKHLHLFPPDIETEARITRQLDQSDPEHKRLIETTDQRLVWKSDKTLLRQGKPEPRVPTFTRITSQTKRRKIEREEPAVIEKPVIDSDLLLD